MEAIGKAPGLDRLLESQLEEIASIEKKIDTYKRYKNDYVELKNLINKMQDKVKHPHNIPIAGTQLAFVPGHLIHTNEFNVLLGDNLFAIRSSRQADKIIDRRLINIDELLKKHEDAKKKTQQWFEAASQHKKDKDQFVEIIETM